MVYITCEVQTVERDETYVCFVRVTEKLDDSLKKLEHGQFCFEAEDGKSLEEMLGEPIPRHEWPKCVEEDDLLEFHGKFYKLRYYFKHSKTTKDELYTTQSYNCTSVYEGSVICLFPYVTIYDKVVN